MPLVINFGLDQTFKPSPSHFDKWWLEKEGYREVVQRAWNTHCSYTDPLDMWQFKIRFLRKKLKDWAINVNAEIKKGENQAD